MWTSNRSLSPKLENLNMADYSHLVALLAEALRDPSQHASLAQWALQESAQFSDFYDCDFRAFPYAFILEKLYEEGPTSATYHSATFGSLLQELLAALRGESPYRETLNLQRRHEDLLAKCEGVDSRRASASTLNWARRESSSKTTLSNAALAMLIEGQSPLPDALLLEVLSGQRGLNISFVIKGFEGEILAANAF